MLMFWNFSILLLVENSIFRAVLSHTAGCLDQIVPEITVSSLVHRPVFGFEFTGVIIFPDDTAVSGKRIVVRKTTHRSHLGKNAGCIDRPYTGNGTKDLILCRIQTGNEFSNGFIESLQLLLICPDTVE